MNQVIKIALPGYNAVTDNNPDHFSLYVNPDERVDYVLIKEHSYETITVPITDLEITHGLGYVPFCLVFAETSSGVWRKLFSTPLDGTGLSFQVDSSKLYLINNSGTGVNFSYRIFYDEIA